MEYFETTDHHGVLPDGYIRVNTEQLPSDDEMECPWEPYDRSTISPPGDFLLDASEDIPIKFGSNEYVLRAGKHFLPAQVLVAAYFQHLRISDDRCKVYIGVRRDYTPFTYIMSAYPFVVPCFQPRDANDDGVVAFMMGCVTTSSNFMLDTSRHLTLRTYRCSAPAEDEKQYSTWIDSHDVVDVQSDVEVTQLLVSWDKGLVRDTNPPSIALSFKHDQYEPLADVLRRKYQIELHKPDRPDSVLVPLTHAEIEDLKAAALAELDAATASGYFTVVTPE